MSKNLKQRPTFRDEADERHFWESHGSNDCVGWSSAERVRLPKLKPQRRRPNLPR